MDSYHTRCFIGTIGGVEREIDQWLNSFDALAKSLKVPRALYNYSVVAYIPVEKKIFITVKVSDCRES